MLGWLRLAAAWASRRKRSTKFGSVANSGNSTLIATWRSSRRSRARNTSAMPPRPMRLLDLVAVVDDRRVAVVGHWSSLLPLVAGRRPTVTRLRRPTRLPSRPSVDGASVVRGVARSVDSSVAAASAGEQPSRAPAWRSGRRAGRRCLREISALVPLSITATAYCGASAGAKAMIQACERSGSPAAVELGGAGLGGDLDAVLEGDAAARRAALDDADHQVAS